MTHLLRGLCMVIILATLGCGKPSSDPTQNVETQSFGRSDKISPRTVTSPAASQPAASAAPTIATFGFAPYVLLARFEGLAMAQYEAVITGDFNGDFRDDVVALPASNAADLFMQNSDGTLSPPQTFRYGIENYTHLKILLKDDFNNDRLPDVAFQTNNKDGAEGGVGLLLSRVGRTPVFHQGHPEFVGMSFHQHIDWVSLDVDRDGNKDIAVLVGGEDYVMYPECRFIACPNIQILKGDGRGNFSKADKIFLGFSGNVRGPIVEDMDGDGVDDIVIMAGNSHPISDIAVFVMKGLPGGGLADPVAIHPLSEFEYLSFADLNGDGLNDSIAGREIHLRSASGDFGPAIGLAGWTSYPATALVHDMDGNGQADIINHQFGNFGSIPFLAVYLQRDGIIQAPMLIQDPPADTMFKVSDHKRAYAVGDVNGDGCPDIVIAVRTDGVALLHGKGCMRKPPRPTGGNLAPRVRQ